MLPQTVVCDAGGFVPTARELMMPLAICLIYTMHYYFI